MTKVKTTLRFLLVLLMLLCLLTGCMGTVQDSGENEPSLSPEPVEEASREAEEAPDPDAPPEVRNFKMRYYSVMLEDILKRHASDLNVGAVESAEDAAQIAEELWAEKYGEALREEKPYRVFWDGEAQVWLVASSGPKAEAGENVKGGCAYILMEKETGDVLALWTEK